jgi:maltose O-acetyltransferase
MMRVIGYLWINFVMWITSFMPDIPHVLRLRGILIGPALKSCGKNFQVAKNVYISYPPDQLEIGRDVFLAYGTWIGAAEKIIIEDEVIIGPYSVIISGDHGLFKGSYRFGHGARAPISLKKGCWLGAHTTVTKGVTIGPGSLLAANSVATRDIPPFCVAGGVPARIIKEAIHKSEIRIESENLHEHNRS